MMITNLFHSKNKARKLNFLNIIGPRHNKVTYSCPPLSINKQGEEKRRCLVGPFQTTLCQLRHLESSFLFFMMSHYIIYLYKTFITEIASVDFLSLVYSLILFHLKFLKKLFTKVTLIWFSPVCNNSCCFTFPFCVRTLLYKLH